MSSGVKRFLFSTDFSAFSDHALEQALLWAKAYGATLDCVYVMAANLHLDLEGAVIETLLDEERKATQPKLDALVTKIQAEVGACVGHFLTGVPDEVISKLAQEIGADCIFMGTRGGGRILIGSTAERVVMTAPCPVLTVRFQSETDSTQSKESPSHLLVPIDFSDCSQDAMEYAFQVASDFDVAVTLLHVREPITSSFVSPLTHIELEKEKNRKMEKQLKEFCRILQEKGLSTSYLMKQPPTSDAILQTLEECGANLIVMGTHGRRGFSRLLMGSVASSVLRRSLVPVLTVKAGKYSKAHPRRRKETVQVTSTPDTL